MDGAICRGLPKTVQHGSFDGLGRPMLEMDEVLARALIPLLDARRVLYQHFLELDRLVKRAASRDATCLRMMTVPGVGPIAALTFKAAVDNPGRISKAGDRDVRSTHYAAANALLMRKMASSQIKS
ncbi:hypothetical protein DT23_14385 [Thioclava indica]|uniref:Uncharacterized protein n=2 Tax=Thioclava indica TaxID=1353528 RepID=A0A074JW03_9RHOB|nr:hypothetical protein DT23_14385 [Thioclava indica]